MAVFISARLGLVVTGRREPSKMNELDRFG